MNVQQNQHVQACLEKLEQGSLTKEALLDTFQSVATSNGDGKRQDLLYLQASGLNPEWEVNGMRLFLDGQWADEPESDEDWPYASVADAMKDGWRIISFPNQALCLDENRTYGLGFEFILEKWR